MEKQVPGFEDYTVTTTGQIISHKRGKRTILKPSITNGYEKVSLLGTTGTKTFQLHRLVAEIHLVKPDNTFNIVNHKDGNKTNNDVSNLEWTNHRGNMDHFKNELAPKQQSDRKKRYQDDLKMRLDLVRYAHEKLGTNHKLFQSAVGVAISDMKL